MCYQCFRFGHVQSQYRVKHLCGHLGNHSHDILEDCPNFKDDPVWVKDNQFPRDRLCPEWPFQFRVNTFVATSNILISEAFYSVTRTDPPSHSSRTHLATNQQGYVKN